MYKINNLLVDSSKYIIDRLNPKFSWGSELVANSKTQTTFKQEKFIISIVDDATSKMVWQSGVIRSSKPVYRAPTLPIQHFRKYTWFVKSFDSRGCWITSEKSNGSPEGQNEPKQAPIVGEKNKGAQLTPQKDLHGVCYDVV